MSREMFWSCLHRYFLILNIHVVFIFLTCICVQTKLTCRTRNYMDIYFERTARCQVGYLASVTDANPRVRNTATSFQEWKYAVRQILRETFPVDDIKENYVRQVRNALFSEVTPIPFHTPVKLVAVSVKALRDILDMDSAITGTDQFVDFVSGSYLHPGATPLSHRYGGHQFGVWADQLGDGRAVLLGEYVNDAGERWELQLKGSGLTPYSRRGDGRAVLRSSVREFLCSEAMHYLGIPTSRAAALVVSGDTVVRDQFYNGHPRRERTAIVLRLAQSWFRIGSLELLSHQGEITLLRQLTDFIINNHFPLVTATDGRKYLSFYSDVIRATAELMAMWQSVGFTHGVCNTDNFSVLSITIDYGPFGFLDKYTSHFVPNSSDDEGMYSYEKQPDIGAFNLDKLRIALLPLLTEVEKQHMRTLMTGYADVYKSKFMALYKKKLGLVTSESDDEQLIAILLKMMEDTASDFTMTFRNLGEIMLSDLANGTVDSKFWGVKNLMKHTWFDGWIRMYIERIKRSGVTDFVRQSIMNSANPRYVLRNWIAQYAISLAENDDFQEVEKVLQVLQNPFTEQQLAEESGYAEPPPAWARSIKVSCSS